MYNTSTKEVSYSTSGTKTFVIDNPEDNDKYLVHACLEGPEAGVYYRGEGKIISGKQFVEIELPSYVDELATEFTVNITPLECMNTFYSSRVVNGKFKVSRQLGPVENECEFYWHVYGKRANIEVEPYKRDIIVKGSGPYKWI